MLVSGAPLPVTTATAAGCGGGGVASEALLPSWPLSLAPQHHTAPPARTAQAWSRPAPTAVASVMRLLVESRACVRVALATPAIPSPSWPLVFVPAHQIV